MELQFNGTANFSRDQPAFNLIATIDSADLNALNIWNEDYILASELKLNFEGSHIDKVVGDIQIFNTSLQTADTVFKLDSLTLTARQLNNLEKSIDIKSELGYAKFNGQYTLSDLPSSLTQFVQNYFKQESDSITTNRQDLYFDVYLADSKNLTQLLEPKLHRLSNLKVQGNFKSDEQLLDLDVSVSELQFGPSKFHGFNLQSNTIDEKLFTNATLESVSWKDSTLVEEVGLVALLYKDSMLFTLQAENDISINRLYLNGLVSGNTKGIVGKLLPSQIVLNGESWQIPEGNEVVFHDSTLVISNFNVTNDGQRLEIGSQTEKGKVNVIADFTEIELGDLYESFFKFPGWRVNGTVSGEVRLVDLFRNPSLVGDLGLEDLYINKNYAGDVSITTQVRPNERMVVLSSVIDGPVNNVQIYGTYKFPKNEPDQMHFVSNVYNIELEYIEPYINKYVSELGGNASGKLYLKGSTDKPQLTGHVNLDSAEVTVNYLNTHYHINKEKIRFRRHWIDLDTVELLDVNNNIAVGSGEIFHKNLKDFSLDAWVKTENFQFLNTTSSHNESYYGTAFAGGTVTFNGPVNDIAIFIHEATTRKGTDMAIPITTSTNVEKQTFYTFINRNKIEETENGQYQFRSSNLKLDLELNITPDAQMQLIFDQQEGDIIKGRGRGNIQMNLNSYGDFNMTGNYEIEEGEYYFTLQNIINKRFEVENGGTIIWSGDPYEAQLNIDAVYRLRARPYYLVQELVQDSETNTTLAKNRVPVYLALNISGSLLRPEIDFIIEMPDIDPRLKSAIETKLTLLEEDENEQNRQVFGLLVLNRFLPTPNTAISENVESSATAAIGVGDVNNTVSEFLSNQLSKYVSEFLNTFLEDVDFNINYRSYENEVSLENPDLLENRRELQLALTKRFFNDRVTIDVGGDFDFGGPTTAGGDPGDDKNQTTNIAGDFIIEYSIREDGRIRLKAFRKSDYDIFSQGNRNKTGMSVFYREEFDKVGEIGQRMREKRALRRKRKAEEKERESLP